MAKNTKISWATHTFNPWIGCHKVSAECEHCYAEEMMDTRFGKVEWGKGKPRKRTSEKNWNEVRKWNREAEGAEERPRVFCSSLADVFDTEVPIEWFADLLVLIDECRNLDWLLLTKRPDKWSERVHDVWTESKNLKANKIAQRWYEGDDWSMPNVWIGVSVGVESSKWRIEAMWRIPAPLRFMSCEPLLSYLHLSEEDVISYDSHYGMFMGGDPRDFSPDAEMNSEEEIENHKQACAAWEKHDGPPPEDEKVEGPASIVGRDEEGGRFIACGTSGLGYGATTIKVPMVNWIIVGGESGPKARPMHPQWLMEIKQFCDEHDICFHFKQWGNWVPRGGYGVADIDTSREDVPTRRITDLGHDGHDLAAEGDHHVHMQRDKDKHHNTLYYETFLGVPDSPYEKMNAALKLALEQEEDWP